MISITIPTWNEKPEYLRECLNSIKNQSLKMPYEIIIIDDGSENRDEIKRIAEEFGARYFYQENAGIGAARRRGVKLASGDHIMTLASHDLLMPNYFEEMLKASRKHPDAICYSDYIIVDQDGNQRGVFRAPNFDNYTDFCLACRESALRSTMFVCYTLFAPAKILREHNFSADWRYGEDLFHLLKSIFVDNLNFVHVLQLLFKYRAHPLNVTSQKWREIPENNRRIFESINKLAGRVIF